MRPSHRSSWPLRLALRACAQGRPGERGTILLMVVGVLALLAIIAVVYATLGRADRASSATVRVNQRTEDQTADIAEYLATVVGDSFHARYTEPVRTQAGIGYREFQRGYTYPVTDSFFLSVDRSINGILTRSGVNLGPLAGNELQKYSLFSPTGDNPSDWSGWSNPTAAPFRDPREFGDPFLSPHRPTFLGMSDGTAVVNMHPFRLASQRDWLNISNFAPSGNFVNLANLRDNFRAPHGFSQLGQLSFGLTLFDPVDGRSYNHDQPNQQFLPSLPGTPASRRRVAHPLIPADWSSNQVYAYRPAVPDATTATGRAITPADHEYLFNQWADADGDGFIDSRWFALDRILDFDQTTSDAIVQSVIPANSRYRWFIAARAVDNSGMLNANVHGDFYNGPISFDTSTNAEVPALPADVLPPGLSPSDVDLARLLTYGDALRDALADSERASSADLSQGFWTNPPIPLVATDPNNYRDYDLATNNAFNAGRAAAASVFDFRTRGASRFFTSGPNSEFPAITVLGNGNRPSDAVIRRDFYERSVLAQSSSSTLRDFGAQRDISSNGRFGADDELEWRRFWNLNDPESRSLAESAAGGRFNGLQKYSPFRDNRSFDVESKGRNVSRDVLFPNATSSGVLASPATQTLFTAHADVRQYLTTISGARQFKDTGVGSQGLLSRPDISAALREIQACADNPYGTFDGRSLNLSANEPNLLRLQNAAQSIFQLYADALVPYTEHTRFKDAWKASSDVWADAPTAVNERFYINGLAYGGSPELATMMAAWMTANLIDMYDRDQDNPIRDGSNRPTNTPLDKHRPTALTLEMVKSPALPTNTSPRGPIAQTSLDLTDGDPYERAYPWAKIGLPDGRPTVAEGRRPLGFTDPNSRPRQAERETALSGRKNFFGIEPQPFITEFGFYYIFTDAPNLAGGDDDEDMSGGATDPNIPRDAITMDVRPSITNADYLGEIIAIQLNNPWDVEIVLYDPNAREPWERAPFYVEFANRFYILADQQEDALEPSAELVTLRAGETRTFYALNPGTMEQMWRRFKNSLDAAPPNLRIVGGGSRDTLRTWLHRQFGVESLQMVSVYPSTFQPITPQNSTVTAEFGQQDEMDLWGERTIPFGPSGEPDLIDCGASERKVVHLWRTMRSTNRPLGSTSPAAPSADLVDAGGTLVYRDTADPKFNDRSNDLLVDRLRDPVLSNADGILWDWRGPTAGLNSAGNGKVRNAFGGDEGSIDPQENSGYTAVTWASIRRPSDRTRSSGGTLEDGTLKPTRGVLPAWCLEVKADLDNASTGSNPGFSLNKEDNSPDRTEAGDIGMFGNRHRTKSVRDMILSTNGPPNVNFSRSMLEKSAASTSAIPKTPGFASTTNFTVERDYREVAVEFHTLGAENAPRGTNREREVKNPMLFSRAGDFLLPLAIGPMYDPSINGAFTVISDPDYLRTDLTSWLSSTPDEKILKRELQWLTLSEALALASGYYNPARTDDPLRNFSIRDVSKPVPELPKTHRGHLRLDAFTPYLFIPTPPATSPTAGGVIEENFRQPLGAGVPFALTIIDQVRAATGISGNLASVDTGSGVEDWSAEQIHRSAPGVSAFVPGLMNINTLSSIPMRQLPMLTPDLQDMSPILSVGTGPWHNRFLRPLTGGGTPKTLYQSVTNSSGSTILNWDIASGIEVWRDKSVVRKRGIPAQTPAATIDVFADFSATIFGGTASNNPLTPRAAVSKIRGLREQRGFKSIGGIFAVNFRDDNGYATGDEWDELSSMQIMSKDNKDNEPYAPGTGAPTHSPLADWPEVASSNYYESTAGSGLLDSTSTDSIAVPANRDGYQASSGLPFQRRKAGQVLDGYQDKLAVINALSNSVTVRSDIFTVYFIIHGYAPEDVEDLDDDQPMVPSIARRYVMTVDRSNVINPGDKPKVVMIKEVPIR